MGKLKVAICENRFLCVFLACLVFSFFLSYSLDSKNDYIQSFSKLFHLSKSSFNEDLIKPTILKPIKIANQTGVGFNRCLGKYIYVHNLPRIFNIEILENCQIMNDRKDICCHLLNRGLGLKFKKGWFNTYEFALEVIFHSKMKHYKCLTTNSSLASAIYVPFYPGLEFILHPGFNTSVRDSTSHSLVKWLSNTPEWKVLGGRDHFIVFGRGPWDFRRYTNDSGWGTNLFLLPEAQNMTHLGIESNLWDNNEYSIPYPSYFHPSSDDEVFQWQRKMRTKERKYLLCFAGSPKAYQTSSIQNQIIEQCRSSKGKCKLLDCNNPGEYNYHSPSSVMHLFQNSAFCLQPSGDAPTRRLTFDSILAGCIPVFFHPASAYIQYIFHLPRNYRKYSVYIPEDEIRNGKVNIESILSRISEENVRAMREEVIKLIPKSMYAHPEAKMVSVEDAFDVAIKSVIKRADEARKEMKNGRISYGYPLENSWKYKLWGRVKEHEWDNFFGISTAKDVNA